MINLYQSKGGSTIKTLTLRLDDDFHKTLKLKCIQDDTDMTTYIINLVKKDMNYQNQEQKK